MTLPALMLMLLLALHLVAGAAVDVSARINELAGQLASMQQQISHCISLQAQLHVVSQELSLLQEQVQPQSDHSAAAVKPAMDNAVVDTAGDVPSNASRRLSSFTYATMPAWQVHEFTSGGSCATTTKMALRPKTSSGLSWGMSTADSTSDVSLVSVGQGWTTSEIQTIPVPLKVVHDASCSAPPSLHLPLDTTVKGNLNLDANIHDQDNKQTVGVTNQLAFLMKVNSGRPVTLKNAKTGKYLTCDGGLTSSDTIVDCAQMFTITPTRGFFVIMCCRNYYNVMLSMSDNGFEVRDNVDTFGWWELFSVYIPEKLENGDPWPDGAITIHNFKHDKYVSMGDDGVVFRGDDGDRAAAYHINFEGDLVR
jgi:hypothetical protein